MDWAPLLKSPAEEEAWATPAAVCSAPAARSLAPAVSFSAAVTSSAPPSARRRRPALNASEAPPTWLRPALRLEAPAEALERPRLNWPAPPAASRVPALTSPAPPARSARPRCSDFVPPASSSVPFSSSPAPVFAESMPSARLCTAAPVCAAAVPPPCSATRSAALLESGSLRNVVDEVNTSPHKKYTPPQPSMATSHTAIVAQGCRAQARAARSVKPRRAITRPSGDHSPPRSKLLSQLQIVFAVCHGRRVPQPPAVAGRRPPGRSCAVGPRNSRRLPDPSPRPRSACALRHPCARRRATRASAAKSPTLAAAPRDGCPRRRSRRAASRLADGGGPGRGAPRSPGGPSGGRLQRSGRFRRGEREGR